MIEKACVVKCVEIWVYKVSYIYPRLSTQADRHSLEF